MDEYGFPNDNKRQSEKFLFQDDYAPDTINGNGQIADNSDSDGPYKSEVDSIEMTSNNNNNNNNHNDNQRRNKNGKPHRLQSDGDIQKKVKKKKKKKKKDKKDGKKSSNTFNAILQTIVLATSPTEDTTMLFEEGPKYGEQNENYNGKQQRSGNGSIVININTNNGNNNNNNNNKNGNNGKNSMQNNKGDKNGKAKSPKSPNSKKIDFGKFNFLKKNNDKNNDDGKNGDASSPKSSK